MLELSDQLGMSVDGNTLKEKLRVSNGREMERRRAGISNSCCAFITRCNQDTLNWFNQSFYAVSPPCIEIWLNPLLK